MREEDDNNDAELSQDERTEEFLHLLNKHERTLSVYVTGLVQPLQDAQDILQDGKIDVAQLRQFHGGDELPRLGTQDIAASDFCLSQAGQKASARGIQ